ncbi:MAG: hypothetical protein RL662_62 [Bacteroidota bacterium]|jgi:uncharacterized integral membrane protein (TIGR00698 family)
MSNLVTDNNFQKKIVFILALLLCLFPFINPPLALLGGFGLSLFIGNPFIKITRKATRILLQVSVVGLGFGMNIYEAMEAGKSGLALTTASILITLALGLLLGKCLRMTKNTSLLISSGTAICGGSAIAALAPIVEANEDETSVSLGVIFILNAIALLIFPPIGFLLNLSQEQFGVWAAIAIHDTSSVVGAAQRYGDTALHLATTIKLERALWIIPLSLITAIVYKKRGNKITIPYFIGLYALAMLANTYMPAMQLISPWLVAIAKKGLTLTLFLIGSGLTLSSMKNIGIKPFLQGVILWICISIGSLLLVALYL